MSKIKISKDAEMTTSIEYASPRHPEIRNLLQVSHDLMGSLFPAEANHFLSIDALCDAGIHFFGVRVDGVYQACGALAVAEGINNQLRRAVIQQRVALISASSTLPSVAAVVANTGTPAIL